MTKKLSIILIPVFYDNCPIIKEYLEKQGHQVVIIEKNELKSQKKSDLVILFVNKINDDDIAFIEDNFKNTPIILNYNTLIEDNSLDEYSNLISLHYKDEMNLFPLVMENAILKKQIYVNSIQDHSTKKSTFTLLENIFERNLNKIDFETCILDILSEIAKYFNADEFQFFVLDKFKNFNVGVKSNITEKYNIKHIEKLYPEINLQTMLKALEKNQELIIFKKDGNVKTDRGKDSEVKHYYSLIVIPVFINKLFYGCVIFNFHNAIENISHLRNDLLFVAKIFSFILQYKIVYGQYENSINQFSRLINDAVNGIYQSTKDGKILYANPAFIKIVGYDSLEELKKIDIFSDLYYSKKDRENFIKKIKKEKAVQNFESVLKKKNGELINIIENSRIVPNQGESILFEGIIQDITHQINLKEKLNYQTSFSEKIIEKASFLIIALNDVGEVIMWNSMAEKITGYLRDELFKEATLLSKIFIGIESIRDYFKDIIKKETSDNEKEYTNIDLIAKDGSKKNIRWSWTIDDYLSENKKQIIGFGIDVTETIKLEEQLFESQKMESIGTLAAGMAYDFNRIFSEMNVYNSSLKSRLQPETKELMYVDKIEDTINKASAYASKLIGLSRREQKKNTKIDVNNCINYVMDLLEHTIDENVQLEKDVCVAPIIQGDVSQINQAILNIAINSKESMSGEGRIGFKSEIIMAKTDEYLSKIQVEETNYVRLSISDTGKGVPKELHQRVFDPFFTTKKSEQRPGLGLSVAYNIIKNHKGYVFVQSENTQGTIIYMYLPYAGEPSKIFDQAQIESDLKGKKSELKKKSKPLILVVDDEMIIRDLLNDVLLDQNYDILLAKDGLEGFEVYTKNQNIIDLVILDIIMPGMSGKEVFEKIREIDPVAKIIITSGYSKQQVTESLMHSGANGFLPKPFNIDKLLGLIKALVKEK